MQGATVEATPNQLYSCVQRSLQVSERVKRVDCTVIMTSVGEVPISEDSILLHESVIHGYHVFKEIWTPQLGEILVVSQETGNTHDRRAVAC